MTLTADDRWAIHETISSHGHIFDEGHLDRLSELFTDDVVYDLSDFGQPPLRGIGEIRRAAVQLGAGNPVAHHVTNIVITGVDPDSVTARCKGLAVMADGSTGSATYVDTLRRVAGKWRISRRTVLARRTPLGAYEAAH
ncbi:MAG: nuclear transport factor 2 family protein [Solirubrobacteraceae bacterium]